MIRDSWPLQIWIFVFQISCILRRLMACQAWALCTFNWWRLFARIESCVARIWLYLIPRLFLLKDNRVLLDTTHGLISLLLNWMRKNNWIAGLVVKDTTVSWRSISHLRLRIFIQCRLLMWVRHLSLLLDHLAIASIHQLNLHAWLVVHFNGLLALHRPVSNVKDWVFFLIVNCINPHKLSMILQATLASGL